MEVKRKVKGEGVQGVVRHAPRSAQRSTHGSSAAISAHAKSAAVGELAPSHSDVLMRSYGSLPPQTPTTNKRPNKKLGDW